MEQKELWDQAFDLWQKSLRCDNTRRVYLAVLKEIKLVCKKELWLITPKDISIWVDGLRLKKLAETTVQLRLCGVTSFYRFAIDECEIPWVGKLPSAGKSLRRHIEPYGKAIWLSTKEVRQLLEVIDRSTLIGKRDYALILGYILTGRRNSEWRRAKLSNFDIRGTVVIYHWYGKGKTNQKQEVPFSVWEAIKDFTNVFPKSPDDFLFTGLTRTTELSSREIGRILKKYCKLAVLNVEMTHVHSLRHTAAMLRKEMGAGLEEMMNFLSHSNLATTQIYVHSFETAIDTTGSKVSTLLGLKTLESFVERQNIEQNKVEVFL